MSTKDHQSDLHHAEYLRACEIVGVTGLSQWEFHGAAIEWLHKNCPPSVKSYQASVRVLGIKNGTWQIVSCWQTEYSPTLAAALVAAVLAQEDSK